MKGINPTLDKKLSGISKILNRIDKYRKGKVIDITVENLPEDTKERKRRKKFLLLLIKQWKGLKREVKRVKKELQKTSSQSGQQKTIHEAQAGGKLIATAKGPLGLLTATAALIAGGVILLNSKVVTVTIQNTNCETINPIGFNVNLPGLKLPNSPIPAGGQAEMTIPPLKFRVDASDSNNIRLSSFRMNFNFDRSQVEGDILLNGGSLLNRVTEIDLGLKKNHTIEIRCQ